jgi:ferric-dicitrate binding protein FerR (iron transport regulator)
MLGIVGALPNRASRHLKVAADQQIRVTAAEWPASPAAVDVAAHHGMAASRDCVRYEPLERVAAEFNRHAPKPIEIATPALGQMQISGACAATDDTDALIAFLRTLRGLRVEVTATRFRISQQ